MMIGELASNKQTNAPRGLVLVTLIRRLIGVFFLSTGVSLEVDTLIEDVESVFSHFLFPRQTKQKERNEKGKVVLISCIAWELFFWCSHFFLSLFFLLFPRCALNG